MIVIPFTTCRGRVSPLLVDELAKTFEYLLKGDKVRANMAGRMLFQFYWNAR